MQIQLPNEHLSTVAHETLASQTAHALSAMLAYWGADERCRYVNEAYSRFFGISAEAMLGIDMRTVLGVTYEQNAAYIAGVLRGEAQEFERRFPRAGLPDADLLATYTPDIAPDGSVRGFVALLTDVTRVKDRLERHYRESERFKVEEAERTFNARFRSVVDSLSIGLIVQGPRAEITLTNPAALELLGVTEAQLLGLTSFDPSWNVIHADGSPFPGETHPVPMALATKRPVRDVIMGVYRPTSDDRVWLLVDAEPDLDASGEVREVLCTFVNITVRLEAETALKQAEGRLRQAVHAAQVALWDWDLVTNTFLWSAEWKRMLGYEADELRNEADFRERLHENDAERVDREMRDFLSGEAPTFESGFRVRRRDGSYRHIVSRATRVLDRSGKLIALTGANVDLTERTELQNQVVEAHKMESLSRLVGGVAHDFNNLLTVINSTTELAMERAPDGTPMRVDLGEIYAAGVRAAMLTQQLLAFGRKQVVVPRVLRLDSVLTEIQPMLRRLVRENIKLRLVLDAGAGSITADRGQLEQVVIQLVTNASEAMPDGGVLTLTTALGQCDASGTVTTPTDGPPSQVILRIRDTGAGMDEATQLRVFEPFFGTKGLGSGLGLSTVYGIVKQSGGVIAVRSALGVGTTFTIALPRTADDRSSNPRKSPHPAGRGTETILVVEDDAMLCLLLTRMLSSAGYRLIVAESGDDALEKLARHEGPVELLLTDLMMPGMNGRELAARVGGVRPETRALFMSGYADDLMDHASVTATWDFISKPYTPDELKRKIRAVLDA